MTIPNSEEERRIVSELTTESNKERDSFVVISKSWYTSWQRYVEQPSEAPRPGPIDNHHIIETATPSDHPQLRRLLVEGKDYVLVPLKVWNRLFEWYNGGPQIPGNLICFFLSDGSGDEDVSGLWLAKEASVRELYETVCAIKKVSQAKARIWDYSGMRKVKLLNPLSDKTLEESGLLMEQDILLEVGGSSSSSQYAMSSAGNELALVPLEPSRKGGLAGLVNLGNTCFMNSALQCLAHTTPILEYFLQDNPLGMSGELAKAFGDLLKELWLSGKNPVEPRFFKTQLDRYVPQFRGYYQQDSHELLVLLLERLHQDLKRKPHIELKDSDTRPNDSVIADVCEGHLQSTLVCPVCGTKSITFDPFKGGLSLPLPLRRSITVTVFSSEGSHPPMSYNVTVPTRGSCGDLITALRTACCLTDDESLLLAKVYEHKISRYFENPLESLSVIKNEDHIVAYRMNQTQKESEKAKLEILHGRAVLESVNGRDLPEVYRRSFSAEKTKQEATSLFSCLEELLGEEPLGLDNMWACPECKEYRQAKTKLDLWELPDILVFHLKRLTTSKYFLKKRDTFVNFPINNLDLSKYVKNNQKGQSYLYELYAVSNHHGGVGVAHYTAYAKLVEDSKWYHFNDSNVSPINESKIKSSAAYLLFYRRVGSETETQSADMSDMD